LIGKELGKKLAEKGHELLIISRNANKARSEVPFPCAIIEGDLEQQALKDPRLKEVEVVFNLLGESVATRWTEAKKKSIYDSRINSTAHLLKSLSKNLKVFISSSATGIYGDRGDEILTEKSPLGEDFLAKVCIDWEKEAEKAVEKFRARVVCVRTGVVLSANGGALDKMLLPFRYGVGGALGKGLQWMSWIHLDDIVGLYIFALENENIQGPLNGVAPFPVTNKEFTKSLASSLGQRAILPVPPLALKLLYGEMSKVILGSQRCDANKALHAGYHFQYERINGVLESICTPYRAGEERLYQEQFLPRTPKEIFPFFQDANNLEKLTPATLQFKIDKISTAELQQGTKIDYTLKIHGVPVKWKTEIEDWHPPRKFVDNQLSGPYSLWHHTHEFRAFCGGTLMIDEVRYRLPLKKLGWMVAGALVRQDIENIFKFRRQFASEMYNK